MTKSPTKDTKSQCKIRRAAKNLDVLQVVNDYQEGTLSVKEIAEKHGTSEDNVSLVTKRFWKSLTNMRESRALIAADTSDARSALQELNHTELINEKLLERLSPADASLLTDEEAQYAWVYVHTGDVREALKVSKLDAGLHKEKDKDTRFSYDRALVLRGMYLNSKPNIVQYIKELREVKLQDANVGKARIQSELIEQLDRLKARSDGKYEAQITRTIELLGKTVGAFVDRVEVQEVNPENALDKLISMAKEAEVIEVDEDKVKEISE